MSLPYYYKSPARRNPSQDKAKRSDKSPQRRSKSPTPAQYNQPGVAPSGPGNPTTWLKMLEEIRTLVGQAEETAAELEHLKFLFNRKERLLRTPALLREAEQLRIQAGIPREDKRPKDE
jgi:hypothetical protein